MDLNKIKNWITSRWKTILGFILLFIAYTYIILYFVEKTPIVSKRVDQLFPVKEKTTKSGDKFAQIQQRILTPQEIKVVYDSIARELAINSKDIQAVTQVVTLVDTVFRTVTIIKDKDSIMLSKRTKDVYIESAYYPNDSLRSRLSFSLTPDTATYIESIKHNFFKPDEFRVDIIHSNKMYNTINGNSFRTSLPKTYLSLGLQGGYNPFNNTFYGGVGLQFDLLPIIRK